MLATFGRDSNLTTAVRTFLKIIRTGIALAGTFDILIAKIICKSQPELAAFPRNLLVQKMSFTFRRNVPFLFRMVF
jgi:hypothetical protein